MKKLNSLLKMSKKQISITGRKDSDLLKKLLSEQSSMAMGGHYGRGGRRGMEVDDIFAGGYVATDSVKGDLTRQLTSRKQKRKEMEDMVGKDNVGIENPLGGHYEIETEMLLATYDWLDAIATGKKKYSDKVTPEIEQLFTILNIETWEELIDKTKKDYKELYDLNSDKIEKFKNLSNKEKYISMDIKYDEKVSEIDKDKYVNTTNLWKHVG